jgi:ABC-type multidrug transport system fused ATPase/permease subunit
VTHQHHFLSKEGVDSIYVLGDGGCVVEKGTFAELQRSANPYVKSFVEFDHAVASPAASSELSGAAPTASIVSDNAPKPLVASHSHPNINALKQNDGANTSPADAQNASFVKQEKREVGGVKWKHLKRYLSVYGTKWSLLLLVIVILGDQGMIVYENVWFSKIAAVCDVDDSNECDEAYQRRSVTVLAGIVMASIGCRALRVVISVFSAQSAARQFHDAVVSSLLSAKISFFDRQLSGRILNRLIGDQSSIDNTIPATTMFLIQTVLAFASVILLVAIDIPIALVGLVLLSFPYYMIYEFYRWSARDLKRLDSVAKSPINAQLTETLDGLSTVRAFGNQCRVLRQHLELARCSVQTFWYQWCANQWITTALELLGVLFTGVIMLVAVYYITNKGLDAATGALMISYSQTLPSQLGWMLKSFCTVEIELVAIERVSEYMDLPSETAHEHRDGNDNGREGTDRNCSTSSVGTSSSSSVSLVKELYDWKVHMGDGTSDESLDRYTSFSSTISSLSSFSMRKTSASTGAASAGSGSAARVIGTEGVRRPARSGGSISITNVTLAYTDDEEDAAHSDAADCKHTTAADDRTSVASTLLRRGPEAVPILKGISLNIKAGEKVCICGRTGAGKSSILQALLRFYDYGGSIKIDDAELSQMTKREARQQFGVIPQEAVLIGSNLGEALVGTSYYGRMEQEIFEMLGRVQMYDKVQSMHGLETEIKVGNDGFSAGERQLLCAARALLQPTSKVLLCDEMSSALDVNVDKTITDIVLADDRTVISIMHRLAHALRFDKVVVMSAGLIIEIGPPAELLAQRGVFFDLYHQQQSTVGQVVKI